MRIGRGVKKEHGLERPSLLADAFEAVVAAIYLERGYDAAKTFVHDALADDVADAALRPGDGRPQDADCASGPRRTASGTPGLRGHGSRPEPRRRCTTPPCASAACARTGEGRSKKSAEAQRRRATPGGRRDA